MPGAMGVPIRALTPVESLTANCSPSGVTSAVPKSMVSLTKVVWGPTAG